MEMHRVRLVAVELGVLSSSSAHADGRRRGRNEGANVETNQERTLAHRASRTSGSWPRIVRLVGGAILLQCRACAVPSLANIACQINWRREPLANIYFAKLETGAAMMLQKAKKCTRSMRV